MKNLLSRLRGIGPGTMDRFIREEMTEILRTEIQAELEASMVEAANTRMGLNAIPADEMKPGYHTVVLSREESSRYGPVFEWLKEHQGDSVLSWHILAVRDIDRMMAQVEFRFEDPDLAFHFKVRWV